MRSPRRSLLHAVLFAAALHGCATPPVAPVARLSSLAAPPAPAFTGYTDVIVPPRLNDGGYATPNRSVSAAGAVWHLRAGLNVAALTCRGPDLSALIAAYNALLTSHRATLATAYRTLGQEYGEPAAFDAAMTRLYNYYALPPAQDGLCQAATAVLRDAASVPPGRLDTFAPAALARLDAPYVAVFARQDTWLATRFAARAPLAVAQASLAPRLNVDPAIFLTP